MNKSILHMDLDTFFVSVERLLDSSLLKKPLLVGGTGDRGVVAACSYETRKFGVHSGMSMQMAKKLCPEAISIKGNSGTYMKYSSQVTKIIKSEVPLFEKTSVDEFYVDLTGMDRFYGNYKFAKELREKIIRECGLPISFGLSENKVVSKVATGEAKPNNQIKIDYGFEKSFLAPLSVRKIPMVGKSIGQTLMNLGVFQVNQLQEMPVELIVSVLGKNGHKIWERANGIDTSPIVPYSERKSISIERTYDRDTIDMEKLKNTLSAMGEKLAYQLRMGNKLTGNVSVRIRYSDFKTYSKQIKVSYTNADHILIPTIQELFKKLHTRRLLIRLVGVRFTDLVGGHYQIDLFEDNEKTTNLYQSLDYIRNRFGCSSVFRASTLGVKSIRGNRNPFDGEPPILLAHRKQ